MRVESKDRNKASISNTLILKLTDSNVNEKGKYEELLPDQEEP